MCVCVFVCVCGMCVVCLCGVCVGYNCIKLFSFSFPFVHMCRLLIRCIKGSSLSPCSHGNINKNVCRRRLTLFVVLCVLFSTPENIGLSVVDGACEQRCL